MFNALLTRPIIKSGFNTLVPKIVETKKKYLVLNGTELVTGTTGTDAGSSAVTFFSTNYRIKIDNVDTIQDDYIYRQYANISIAGFKTAYIEWAGSNNYEGSTTFYLSTGTQPSATSASIVRTSTFTQRLESLNLTNLNQSISYFIGVIVYTTLPTNATNTRQANIYNIYLEG